MGIALLPDIIAGPFFIVMGFVILGQHGLSVHEVILGAGVLCIGVFQTVLGIRTALKSSNVDDKKDQSSE
jgi:hypothetical protein